jgi:hypothetical protein
MGSRFNTLLNEHRLKRNNNSLGYYTYINNNLETQEPTETTDTFNDKQSDINLTNIYEKNEEVKIDKINPLNYRVVKKDDITKKKPLKYSVNFKDIVNMNRIKQLQEQSQEQNDS